MYQTDEIHESFYNLFNLNFNCIDDPEKGLCYFTYTAIGPHTKPCLVHRKFQCVVVIKQSEVPSMPPPFLSRFEKYLISHKLLLESRLMSLPTLLRVIFQTAHEKVRNFLACYCYVFILSQLWWQERSCMCFVLCRWMSSLEVCTMHRVFMAFRMRHWTP